MRTQKKKAVLTFHRGAYASPRVEKFTQAHHTMATVSGPEKFSRDYLPTGKVYPEHALKVEGVTSVEVPEVMQRMEHMREKVRLCSRNLLTLEFMREAIAQKMMFRNQAATCFNEVRNSWKEDSSIENAEKVFKVVMGQFDGHKGKAKMREFEKTILMKLNWACKDDPKRVKQQVGFVNNFLWAMRKELARRIIDPVSTEKGIILRFSRTGPQRRSFDKNWRRNPGQFYPHFYINPYGNPQGKAHAATIPEAESETHPVPGAAPSRAIAPASTGTTDSERSTTPILTDTATITDSSNCMSSLSSGEDTTKEMLLEKVAHMERLLKKQEVKTNVAIFCLIVFFFQLSSDFSTEAIH